MSRNDPYSRDEIDLKLENLFHRFQADTVKRDQQMLDEFRKIDSAFRLMEKDISWIKILLTGSNLALLVALVGVIVPIAWTLWSFAVRFPGG